MKTTDLVQLGALAVIGYLAWQKFGKKGPATTPSTQTIPATTPIDFGVSNPDDTNWGDSAVNAITLTDRLLTAYL